MRLWTLHPKYLDSRGLVALWREGLLARAVLRGTTVGYRDHPQLERFEETPDPVATIDAYLAEVLTESRIRGYSFDEGKIPAEVPEVAHVEETAGQLGYEWDHLLGKLEARDPERHEQLSGADEPEAHPLFEIVPGDVREWEKGA
jgi:hypothetical protein